MIDLEDRSIIISISCIARKYHVFGTILFNIVKKKPLPHPESLYFGAGELK